ncbi:MAG: hypothetical protein JXQ73_11255 [Phycisphaerae bacterium]|nr:hypothetical protein [Phycisphaerae bacterium]
MDPWRFPRTIRGQWVTTVMIVCLIVAPFGCETAFLFGGGTTTPGNNDNPYGLLINTDAASNVLGGIRLADGRSVWVYGTFNDDGSIREITGAGMRNAEGQEAGVLLEDGRPKTARSYDGSTLDFTYDVVSAERLKGHVDVFIAETGDTQTVDFDIDLKAAAADLAQAAADLAGLTISDEEPPTDQATAKLINEVVSAGAGKEGARELSIVLIPVCVASFAVLGYVIVAVMVPLLRAVIDAVAAVYTAIAAAVIISIFAPFIIMGDILRMAAGQPVVTIRFGGLLPGIVFDDPLFW